jgi:general stress protein 26
MNQTNTNYQRLAELLQDMKFTMMTTIDQDGSLYSRPMVALHPPEQDFDGRLWFFTKRHTPKVQSIENDQHINLAYADPKKQRFISLSGKATLEEDKERMQNLWTSDLKEWFPEGLEDEELSLICVRAESAEIWDAGAGGVTRMVGLATAFGALGSDGRDRSEGERINLN